MKEIDHQLYFYELDKTTDFEFNKKSLIATILVRIS